MCATDRGEQQWIRLGGGDPVEEGGEGHGMGVVSPASWMAFTARLEEIRDFFFSRRVIDTLHIDRTIIDLVCLAIISSILQIISVFIGSTGVLTILMLLEFLIIFISFFIFAFFEVFRIF